MKNIYYGTEPMGSPQPALHRTQESHMAFQPRHTGDFVVALVTFKQPQ